MFLLCHVTVARAGGDVQMGFYIRRACAQVLDVMSERQIFIHAGAHRTGSSSFQMCLHENRTVLAEAGYQVEYPQRDGISSGDLALRLPAPRHGRKAMTEFANRISKQFANPGKPLILSEENIPGRMIHFYEGKFYPAAQKRFETLRAGLQDARIMRLVFLVRAYDSLCVSGFRKRAEDNAVDPFNDQRERMVAMDRGWFEIVQMMRDILRPEQLLVLPYENRGKSVELLQRLVPDAVALPLVEPERNLNTSATDAALEALQARYWAGEKLPRSKWRDIIAQYAADTERRGFAEFTDKQRSAMQARYEADVARIAKMRDVTLLD